MQRSLHDTACCPAVRGQVQRCQAQITPHDTLWRRRPARPARLALTRARSWKTRCVTSKPEPVSQDVRLLEPFCVSYVSQLGLVSLKCWLVYTLRPMLFAGCFGQSMEPNAGSFGQKQ